MYRLVERRSLWFSISLLGILPGILFILWNLSSTGGLLPLSIDYTGGTQWEMRFEQPVAPTELGSIFVDAGFTDTKAFHVDDDRTVQVKFKNIDMAQKEVIELAIVERLGEFDERLYRSIGPAIGAEVSQAALLAVIAASILILAYIAFAFREVSHPFSLRCRRHCGLGSRRPDNRFISVNHESGCRLGIGRFVSDRNADRNWL